jgi:aspartyl/asparaginyl beta-hydroxylase (cupin superfamily)
MASTPWFGFASKPPYPGGDPAYFDPDELGWPRRFEEATATILSEFAQRLSKGRSPAVFFDESMVTRHGTWKSHSLYVHGLRYHHNLQSFPRTDALLRSIPGLVSASFSLLEPGGEILPHHGDSNMIVRGHLALVVPDGLPACGFEVDGQQRPWEAGRTLLFCDAYTHRAWNHSPHSRLIMIIDAMRPEYVDSTRPVCARVLSSILIMRIEARLRQRLPDALGFERFSRPARLGLIEAFTAAWWLYLPLQRRLSWLPPR